MNEVLKNGKIILSKVIELQSDEKPVYLTRQHWFVFRNPFLVTFFLPFFLLSGVFFLDYSNLPRIFKDNLNQSLVYLSFASFIIGILTLAWKYFLWKKTYYLITNKRLIIVTQYTPFHHDDREMPLYRVQDVKAEVNGLQASLYGFGNVVVQISSKDAALKLEKVGKPHLVQRLLMREAHLREEIGLDKERK